MDKQKKISAIPPKPKKIFRIIPPLLIGICQLHVILIIFKCFQGKHQYASFQKITLYLSSPIL